MGVWRVRARSERGRAYPPLSLNHEQGTTVSPMTTVTTAVSEETRIGVGSKYPCLVI